MIKSDQVIPLYIVNAFDKYVKLMGLDKWTIILRPMNLTKEEADDGWQAETDAETEYYRAVIDIFIPNVPEDEADRVARHELLHVMTSNYFGIVESLTYKNSKKAIRKLEERITTELETMPIWQEVSNIGKSD